jgi:type II secretory pathway component PulF
VQTYAYVAVEPSGRKSNGFIEANDQDAAIAKILAEGRFVLEMREHKQAAIAKPLGGHGKVSRADLALFTRRLADLSSAGLPLDRVLQVISEQSESGRLSAISLEALAEVRGGMPVSEALAMHSKYFPEVFTQTLRAGEASGQFAEVAGRLADFQENEVSRRSQVVSALIYPSVLCFAAVVVIIFLMTFVVPRMKTVFSGLGNELPFTTKALLSATDFLTKDWMYIIGGLVIAVILWKVWSSTENGAISRDRLLFRAPLVGKIINKAIVSRYSRVLGTLIFGGVPILESLRLAGLAAGNRIFRISSDRVEEDVREGKSIADSMRDTEAFPPVLTHMVAIGEETGDLPKMLGRVSDSLDFEVDIGMRRLTALVEPIIVISMGIIVGFVVLSVLLPIYAAQNLVK